MSGRAQRLIRRVSVIAFAIVLLPAVASAQAPWERAASNLATHVHRTARAVACACLDRDRRTDVHVR